MKRKKKTLVESIDREAKAAITVDVQSMSKADVLDSLLGNYSQLQRLWIMLLHEDRPCWPLLEQVSEEMKIMEQTLEPLLRRCL
jgi:hypothetical protein